MAVCLVRVKENCEFVGIWLVDKLDRLFDAVDECVSPFSCEFITIREGGIYAPSFAPMIEDNFDDFEETSMAMRLSHHFHTKACEKLSWRTWSGHLNAITIINSEAKEI